MRFLAVVLALWLAGCTGADGKTYRTLVVETERRSFIPEGMTVVLDSFAEDQYKEGVTEACVYAHVNVAMRQGMPKSLIPLWAAAECQGYADRVWDAFHKGEDDGPTASELLEDAGISVERF